MLAINLIKLVVYDATVVINRVVVVVVQGVAVAGCKERCVAVQGVAAVAVQGVAAVAVQGVAVAGCKERCVAMQVVAAAAMKKLR